VIAFVRGRVESRDGAGVVIDVGGVGLRVEAPTSSLSQIGVPGEVALLHTYLHVREDLLALYGFATEDERRLFQQLITVTGVGPRNGLAMLSALSVDQVRGAIARNNPDLLTAVPGIGKRLASRIVLDLKDKVGPRGPAAVGAGIAAAPGDGDAEVLEALTAVFGYTPLQAAQAVAALPPDAPADLQERIALALRFFSGSR
jgi:Holliday junction DNA helicase RuvA